ncbi:MAG TPA: hypothetical protein PLV03_03920 [Clostridiales bacterium]|nr:hypothetical protein [Clostridiales bacterium]HPR74933.1 hypothetical protein [Oscillospiraceae bacterium]
MLFSAVIFAVTALFFVSAAQQIQARLGSELEAVYNFDDPLYWAVGHGILNGLTPYADLFETKPPGIFWLSALSLRLTGGVYAMSIFNFCCLLVICAVPVAAAFKVCRRKTCDLLTRILMILSALSFGAMLMLYAQNHSGHVQIEAMGSAFVCIYLFLIFDRDADKLKPWSPGVILSGLFLACAGLLKEPFVLVAAGASLLFAGGIRAFIYKTVLPLLYGGIIGTAAMAATGVLKPYLTIYLKYMLSSRIGSADSPFTRMLEFKRLIVDLGEFSPLLLCMMVLFMLLVFLYMIQDFGLFLSKSRMSRLNWIGRFFALPLAVLSASFAVSIGGQYFCHHFVFALPLLLALFLPVLRGCVTEPVLPYKSAPAKTPFLSLKKWSRIAVATLFVVLAFAFYIMPSMEYDDTLLHDLDTMKTHAEYVDRLLDEKGLDRYLFLGFNSGPAFIGLTEHSPLGPVFVQDPANFTGEYDWFEENLLTELGEAEIVFLWDLNVGELNNEVWQILNTEFMRDDAHSVSMDGNPVPGVPDGFTYITYVRK